jgi:2-haloalkanoic acid dehalogenase type II
MFTGLQPLLKQLPTPNPYVNDRTYTLSHFTKFERHLQETQPKLLYRQLLAEAYIDFASFLELPVPAHSEAEAFGASIGTWPAHPDTVAALLTLKKHYKLVMLSNIDNDTIARTQSGPLAGVKFDAVYTAEMIGSYKPDLKNFKYLLEGVKREFGVEKGGVLHTAQALHHDMMPAKTMGMSASWIDREREDEQCARMEKDGKVAFTWRFETLGEMAEEVERAFAEQKK